MLLLSHLWMCFPIAVWELPLQNFVFILCTVCPAHNHHYMTVHVRKIVSELCVHSCENEWSNGHQWQPSGLILVLQRCWPDASETDEGTDQGPSACQLNCFDIRFQFLYHITGRVQWTLIHESCGTQYKLGHYCWNSAIIYATPGKRHPHLPHTPFPF